MLPKIDKVFKFDFKWGSIGCKKLRFYTQKKHASKHFSQFSNKSNHLLEYKWGCHAYAQLGFGNLIFLQGVK